MNGLSREQIGRLLMERHDKTCLSALDNNGATHYCIYGVRSYQLEQWKKPEWKPNALLKCGKAGSITQRMRQYEQLGCYMKCEWVIWTSKQSARDVEKYVHSLLQPYRYRCSESVATETFSIDTDNSIYIANMIKNKIRNRTDVLGMDIFDYNNTQKYTFRETTRKVYPSLFFEIFDEEDS